MSFTITLPRIDPTVIAYSEWRKHAELVATAYAAWDAAEPPERPRRFAAFLEELDREQRACELYASAIAAEAG